MENQTVAPFFDTSDLLKEFGWVCAYYNPDGNSEYSHWVPSGVQERVGNIYVFDYYHRNSGRTLSFVWANNLQEAEILVENTIHGVPSFRPKTLEQVRVLLDCITH